jgi:small subunit ribosomal protein S33
MTSTQAIQKLSQQIFGHLPNMHMRTGNKFLKKRFTGIIEARYYPESITPIAKKTSPGYLTEQEDRRMAKLDQLRRRGKGPPQKGSGKRKKK